MVITLKFIKYLQSVAYEQTVLLLVIFIGSNALKWTKMFVSSRRSVERSTLILLYLMHTNGFNFMSVRSIKYSHL